MKSILIALLIASGSVMAAEKTVTVTGTYQCTVEDCYIDAGDGYSFAPSSAVAKKIGKVCGVNELCKFTLVVGSDDWVTKVISVTKGK